MLNIFNANNLILCIYQIYVCIEIAPWLHVFRAENAVDFSQITFDPRQKELVVGAR